MQRHGRLLPLLAFALALNACSHGGANATSATTAPSAAGALGLSSRLTAKPLDLNFPPRNEGLDFRKTLETQYQNVLKRTATSTFVDVEGDIVWTGEYLRYRVNACDHPTAIAKVLAEIGGAATPAVCGTAVSVVFPPRNESLDFRKQLEIQYQSVLKRAATSTFVDLEGDAVWTQEYFRFRLNACDHATAVTDVLTEINNAGTPAGCGCSYALSPSSQSVPSSGGNFAVQLIRSAGSCPWTASADSFVTLSTNSGTDPTSLTYSVAANNGGARTGTLMVAWNGGSTNLTLSQAASPIVASFSMTDPAAQAGPTTTCKLHGAVNGQSTTCNLTSTSTAPSGDPITNYQWTATYMYDQLTTISQAGPSPNFNITDTCGGNASSNDGATGILTVTLTITDTAGNISTATSGVGNQPSLAIRFYTCGSTVLNVRN
jgi:hypothetical protein